jgi:hypothetical protein
VLRHGVFGGNVLGRSLRMRRARPAVLRDGNALYGGRVRQQRVCVRRDRSTVLRGFDVQRGRDVRRGQHVRVRTELHGARLRERWLRRIVRNVQHVPDVRRGRSLWRGRGRHGVHGRRHRCGILGLLQWRLYDARHHDELQRMRDRVRHERHVPHRSRVPLQRRGVPARTDVHSQHVHRYLLLHDGRAMRSRPDVHIGLVQLLTSTQSR